MNFLAIDTSGKHLTVLAYRDGVPTVRYLPDCALRHSVVLMDEIDGVLSKAGLSLADCDFFAAVVGPGSFTGIRIGISTVKGLCLAAEKPALALTSFDCVAYAERGKILALADAGRGEQYAMCATDGKAEGEPFFLPNERIAEYAGAGYRPFAAEATCEGVFLTDPSAGLLRAALAKAGEAAPAGRLHAMYMRRSSAEENR